MQWLLAANWNQYRYAGDFTPSSTLIPIGPTPHAVTPPTAVPTGYPAALDVILNGEGQLVGHHTLDYVGLDNFMGWYVGYEWDSPDGGTIIDIYEKDPVISASTQWYLHVYDNTGASGDGAGITADVAFNVDGSLTFSSWAAWDDVTNDPISLADGGLQDAIGGASGPIGLTLAYADTTHYSEKTTYRYDDATTVAASERLGLGRLVEVDDEVRPISMTINDNQTPVEHFTHQTYDPITGQVASITSNEGTIHYEYDANGSLLTTTKGGQTTRYVWDLRNRMVGIDANNDGNTADTGDTNIAYDSNGVRASELTVGGTSTYFLNDPNNPTGYTKAVEEKPSAGSAPSRSYVFGQKVEGQSDATNGTLYFMTDGHGSTRALIDLGAAVQEREDYDAFGTLLGTLTATSSKTTWLFGGDGLWDPATGWTYHLARWRNGFAFTSYDSFEADPTSPATLHKYEYANNNPLIYLDGSGNSLVGELLTVANISRVVVGIAFGLSGSWNIAHSVFDVEQAFSLTTSDSPSARLRVIGLIARSIVEMYTGLVNIQTANILLFGSPTAPLPPAGLGVLRVAFAAAGDNPLVMGAMVYAMSPAVAATVVNAAGAFLAVNTFFSTSAGNPTGGSSASRSPKDILMPNGKPVGVQGSGPSIRRVTGGLPAAEQMFKELTQNGKDVTPATYPGKIIELPGGGRIGFRPVSSSDGTPVIDIINMADILFNKIHFIP